jgi:hypothetical protein
VAGLGPATQLLADTGRAAAGRRGWPGQARPRVCPAPDYIFCTSALYIQHSRPAPKRLIFMMEKWLASPTEVGATRNFNGLRSQTGITPSLKSKGFFPRLQTPKPSIAGRAYPPIA